MRISLIAICAMLLAVLAVNAGENAAVDKAKTCTLGGIEVIALRGSEPGRSGSADLLVGAGKADLERAKQPGMLDNSINAFVVKMNGKTYLFDTGMPDDTIASALKQAGIEPAAIDAIIITHFHLDHVGGLLKDGKPVYPNAELYVPFVEVEKWTAGGTEFLAAYSPRTYAFGWYANVVPGVYATDAAGHTPGHTVFRLEAGGGSLLILGDLIHLGGVQLPNPDLAVVYDTDPVMAVQARKRVFNQAAEEGITVAAMHLPYPGIGVLKKDGDGFQFDTANFK